MSELSSNQLQIYPAKEKRKTGLATQKMQEDTKGVLRHKEMDLMKMYFSTISAMNFSSTEKLMSSMFHKKLDFCCANDSS